MAPSSRAGAACGCALILDAGAGCGRWHSRCPETDLQVQGPMAARAPVGPPLQGQSVCLQELHTLVNEGTGWVGLLVLMVLRGGQGWSTPCESKGPPAALGAWGTWRDALCSRLPAVCLGDLTSLNPIRGHFSA